MSADVVYCKFQPYLHCIDQCTRWSETVVLQSCRPNDQVSVLNHIQIHGHGNTATIRASKEYSKEELLSFCASIGATATSVAANYQKGSTVVEHASRSIRSCFDRITAADSSTFLVDAFSAASFSRIICRDLESSSSFAFLYDRSPRVADSSQSNHRDSQTQATQAVQ